MIVKLLQNNTYCFEIQGCIFFMVSCHNMVTHPGVLTEGWGKINGSAPLIADRATNF